MTQLQFTKQYMDMHDYAWNDWYHPVPMTIEKKYRNINHGNIRRWSPFLEFNCFLVFSPHLKLFWSTLHSKSICLFVILCSALFAFLKTHPHWFGMYQIGYGPELSILARSFSNAKWQETNKHGIWRYAKNDQPEWGLQNSF